MSFRYKLILTLSTVMLGGLVIVSYLSLSALKEITVKERNGHVSSKIELLLHNLKSKHSKLVRSGLEGSYSRSYKLLQIKDLKIQESNTEHSESVFILDSDRNLLISPWKSYKFDTKELENPNGQKTLEINGEKWIINYQSFPEWDWILGYAIQEREQFSLINNYVKKLSILLAIFIGIAIVTCFFTLRKLMAPLVKLAKGASNFGKGDFEQRIDINSSDEVGELAKAFNDMAKKLQSYTENLEEEVHQQTQKVKHQQSMLADASRLSALGEMAGGIAHEINNPLSIISGHFSIIHKQIRKNNFEDERVERSIVKIEKTILRITKIISGLKKISRKSGDNEREKVALSSILDDVLDVSREKFSGNGIKLEVDLDNPVNKKEVLCDPVQISQVILILLNNAVDAIQGEKELWVRIELSEDQKNYKIRVADSGKGVPEELRSTIFNPFYTSKEAGKGTGLGLSISHSIIKAHDGSIEVDSSSSESAFLVTLPKP